MTAASATQKDRQNARQLGLATIRRRAAPELPAGLAQLNPRLARVLAARGISDPAQLDHDLAALLPPGGMPDLERAAGLVADAIEAGQRILIVGDFDADGATATALCLRCLMSRWSTT